MNDTATVAFDILADSAPVTSRRTLHCEHCGRSVVPTAHHGPNATVDYYARVWRGQDGKLWCSVCMWVDSDPDHGLVM